MGLTDRKGRKCDKERKYKSRTSDATNPQKTNNDQNQIGNVVTGKEHSLNAVGSHSVDSLAIADRNEILSNREISIQCLDDFSTLLNLQTPSQLYYSTLTHAGLPEGNRIQAHTNAVQIHFINSHYVVSAQTNGCITVYDSIPSSNRVNELLEQLKMLYVTLQNYQNPISQIRYTIPQYQGTTSDCGVFACANAQLLMSGIDPSTVVLDQSQLRNHVYCCLNRRYVFQLPIISRIKQMTENVKMDQFSNLEKRCLSTKTNTNNSQQQPIYAHKEPINNQIRFLQSSTEYTQSENKTKSNDVTVLERKREATKSNDVTVLERKREATRQRVQKKRNDPIYSEHEKAVNRNRKKTERLEPTYYEHEKAAIRKSKQKQRQDSNYAKREKETTRERKQRARIDAEYLEKEKAATRERKQKARMDTTYLEKEKTATLNRKQKARMDTTFLEKEKTATRDRKQKARMDTTFLEKEKTATRDRKQKARTDTVYAEKEKSATRERKQKARMDTTFLEKEKTATRDRKQKARTDTVYAEKEKSATRERKQKARMDTTFLEKEKTATRDRKQKARTDSIFAEKEKSATRDRMQKARMDTTFLEKEKTATRDRKQKARSDSIFADKEKSATRDRKQRARTDAIFVEKEKTAARERKQKARMNTCFLEQEKQANCERIKRKRKDDNFRAMENEKRKKFKASSNKTLEDVIDNFKVSCNVMPVYVCSICNRCMFKKQVQNFKRDNYQDQTLVSTCLEASNFHNKCANTCQKCALWICKTCHSHMKESNMPNQASANGMELLDLPKDLASLNSLERHLVSPVIAFTRVQALPRSLMLGLHGPCVTVPADISRVANILPRQLDDSSLVKLKLKRKMEYKGHHLFMQVSPKKVFAAIKYLKVNNPDFKGR